MGFRKKHERAERNRFYSSRRWRKLAAPIRKLLCAHCLDKGRLSPAQEVHHRGGWENMAEAMDLNRLVPLCKKCHRVETAGEQRKKRKAERIKPKDFHI